MGGFEILGMSPGVLALIALAGIGTGIVGYLTGLASLVSYPVLLAAGLSPVAANVSNTLGLVGVGVGSTARALRTVTGGSRRTLAAQLAVAAVGGGLGAALLLVAGESSFTAVVPWLIVLASVLLLLSPRISRLRTGEPNPVVYWIGLFLVCCYGGYFGAGAGVMYLALTLIASSELFTRAMVIKSLLLGVSNLVASLIFIGFGPVNWAAAIALGLGCVVGGNFGPVIQRLIPEQVLRAVVAAGGFFLAVWLWWR
ncbi:sulfite exporter TauE/SafE family protein [Raineyella sp. W15-4]|uniref:sulfite exporter TauE/SafE family protein n=1 Tax=Raineyella sp. W15-4 TaxID=3081651 RepID=UPI0029544483|nr:sulfite exporter TauE/SafE family protein [Raineyella sp. W15-4]WOQ17246.1 sulfite exporter TauE/SafE family protein [Raineyella sp. W15-4]